LTSSRLLEAKINPQGPKINKSVDLFTEKSPHTLILSDGLDVEIVKNNL
jgi:hypothetical protein